VRIGKLPKANVLYLDETHVRLSEGPSRTLVLPGDDGTVHAAETTHYAARYDMIACITADRVFAPAIFTPQQRSEADVRGINTSMLCKYIETSLAQQAGALDRYPLYLVIDNAGIHSKEKMLQAFHDNGCQDMVDIIFMPSYAAKRMSPLDNSLFHEWKEAIRKRCPLTENSIAQVMSDCWANLDPAHFIHHIRHCGLTSNHTRYFDCPDRLNHRHEREVQKRVRIAKAKAPAGARRSSRLHR
jgi:hypothetical protein